MKKKRVWHLRTRIMAMNFITLIIVFALMALVFNLFINMYIRDNASEELQELMAGTQIDGESLLGGESLYLNDEIVETEMDSVFQPDSQSMGEMGTKGTVLIIADDGGVLDPMSASDEVVESIANYFETIGNLSSLPMNYYISVDSGKYYVSVTEDMLQMNAYMVFYVDVTAIKDFVITLNQGFLVILLAGMVLALLIMNYIANSVSGSINSLSGYAAQIGNGRFEAGRPILYDAEFDHLAEDLSRMADKLEAAQDRQNLYFQNISHELRTPLMSIRCYAEGITCGLMDPHDAGTTILMETDRLSALIEELIYISKLDAEQKISHAEKLDLRETVSACVARIHHVAEEKGIHFDFRIDEGPVFYCYNENDMEHVCDNLISNAVRYAGKEVAVSCHTLPDGVELTVTNDGEAIAPEDYPHIFERFYKGKNGIHGIGLAIVKSVVDLYGGTITVTSGSETSFQILFPKEGTASQSFYSERQNSFVIHYK